MAKWFRTLKSQIMAALLALILLFALASFYSLEALEAEREDDALLRLGGELRLVVQQLAMQAMNYKENAPRDYPTYYRDLRLYYQDLRSKTNRLAAVSGAFDQGRFPPELTGIEAAMKTELDPLTRSMAKRLALGWQQFEAELQGKLGSDPEEPRLEWAAEHVIAAAPGLEAQIDDLWAALQEGAARRKQAADRLHRAVLALAMLLGAAIVAWFYLRVLGPLGTTVEGVRRIAAGDFRHQLPLGRGDEIGWLAFEFNRLSARLHAVFNLLTRLQQGSDLEETLLQVSRTLPDLLPLDWVGILFVDPDGRARLEAACQDGRPTSGQLERFPVAGTPLESSLREQHPQHIHDLQGLASHDRRYRLLRLLSDFGMRDAIFLPIKDSPLPGVLVFAVRQANAYTRDHVELMSNLTLLITLSFGKTLRLVERGRLAAIGEFASRIGHEIRNPLATITLALEYLGSVELPDSAAKRVRLATTESVRLATLLSDLLLFAKPIRLEVRRLSLGKLVREFIDDHRDLLESKQLQVAYEPPASVARVEVDPERFRQVMLNLLKNAIDAAPVGGSLQVEITEDAEGRAAELCICNSGLPMEAAVLEAAFEPFFSTKPHGTGLGLGIVRNLVEAHGGRVLLAQRGDFTCAVVELPLAAGD